MSGAASEPGLIFQSVESRLGNSIKCTSRVVHRFGGSATDDRPQSEN